MTPPPCLMRFLEIFCRHEFSWPHVGIDGHDYQICVICGTVYEFDCATMRRTRRLPGAPSASQRPSMPA
jgi:hypothetical protein